MPELSHGSWLGAAPGGEAEGAFMWRIEVGVAGCMAGEG